MSPVSTSNLSYLGIQEQIMGQSPHRISPLSNVALISTPERSLKPADEAFQPKSCTNTSYMQKQLEMRQRGGDQSPIKYSFENSLTAKPGPTIYEIPAQNRN